ncbi:MAG: spore coat protein U domain-containing protein [Vulcanimicrobiaceae bacterium]
MGALALCEGLASAGTQTANVSITANVIQSCTALTPSSGTMSFTAYDAFTNRTTPDNDTTPVTFTTNCTKGASSVFYTVSGGNNCSSSPVNGTRAMKNGTNYLAYQLFEDSGYTTPWAIDTSTCAGTTQLSPGTITSSSQNLSFSLYGQIPAGQDALFGTGYTDSVTVTVNF